MLGTLLSTARHHQRPPSAALTFIEQEQLQWLRTQRTLGLPFQPWMILLLQDLEAREAARGNMDQRAREQRQFDGRMFIHVGRFDRGGEVADGVQLQLGVSGYH